MKTLLSLFIFILAMTGNNSCNIEGKGFKGHVFNKDHFVMISIRDQASRYTPTNDDIIKAEELLANNLEKINKPLINQGGDCPIIHKKLKKYIRQYVGFINKDGEKIIWINFIWKDKVDKNKLSQDIYTILDGCSYYWNIKVNLDKQELFDLNINGSA
ncbi:MAG: hypothetical protein DRJ10_06365 [Bacteroidetes bacterium]|nr:MAG: hypothetical protein DRJ10_06365 [Bacteroidota bacterium]